jgi:hypothetical protein
LRPLLIVIALIAVLSAIPGHGSGRSKFAGYLWTGRVVSVQGSWGVPAIAPNSRPGVAATWIGAQSPGATAQFIQIGSNEELLTASITHHSLPGPIRAYYAFWSDVAHHFHPISLFQVRPGDVLHARMTLRGGKWTLAIDDQTSGAAAHLTTTDETTASFNQAQWTQEDVTDGKNNRAFPYPSLSKVTFIDLAVNGHPVTDTELSSQVLSEHGTTVDPGLLAGDSFTLAQH